MTPGAKHLICCDNGLVARTNDTKEPTGDVVDLVVAYAKQETIGPLRGAGRWILWGLVSMVFMALGMVLLSLGVLRLVQDLGGNTLDGALSWIPYVVGLVASACVVGFALTRVRSPHL